jgi:hypothetical protein
MMCQEITIATLRLISVELIIVIYGEMQWSIVFLAKGDVRQRIVTAFVISLYAKIQWIGICGIVSFNK